MKKTLVAVAALAASAAFAQSSVTLYGVADAYFGSQKAAAAPGAGVSQTVVNDGGLSSSRIGVSVKEDLGAGLSAFAVIEGGVQLDGGAGGLGADRKSVVGLSGDFGSVSLGRQDTPYQNAVEGIIDAQGDTAFSAVEAAMNRDAAQAGGAAYSSRAGFARRYNNSIRYDSPNFDGFSGAIQVNFGENKPVVTGSAARGYALNLSYVNGPLAVTLANQNDKAAGVNVKSTNTTALGGSYDFGPAKLNLGYIRENRAAVRGTASNDSARTVNIGVVVPVDAFTFVAQYANTNASNHAGSSKSFALEGRYALSKRTTAYVGYNNTRDSEDSVAGSTTSIPSRKSNRFGVGMRHVF